jgi:hypothetical protein
MLKGARHLVPTSRCLPPRPFHSLVSARAGRPFDKAQDRRKLKVEPDSTELIAGRVQRTVNGLAIQNFVQLGHRFRMRHHFPLFSRSHADDDGFQQL